MKRVFFLTICLLMSAAAVRAQDMIVRCDSVRHEARVLEIRPDEVRYKRFSNPDGPVYVLPVSAIAYIRYANGEVDRFAATSTSTAAAHSPQGVRSHGTPAPLPTPVAAVQPVDGSATDGSHVAATTPSPQEQAYAVGDYYNRDGVEGIVCRVDEGGHSGLLLSLDQASLAWCRQRNPVHPVGADNKGDGAANMEALARHIEREGLAWEDFPAFAWCRNKGEGWYLPSVDEWLTIGSNYNGGTRLGKQRSARNRFNDALVAHGGRKMDRVAYYFTSTESSASKAILSHLSLTPPYVTELPKHSHWLVRAVHRF